MLIYASLEGLKKWKRSGENMISEKRLSISYLWLLENVTALRSFWFRIQVAYLLVVMSQAT